MHTVEELNGLGGELERLLNLRFAPIAMKLINEDEIPEGCIRPKRDRNVHYALCQAFAAVRRERKALALFKEDHWCVWPVLSLRLEEMEAGDPEYLGPMMFTDYARDRASDGRCARICRNFDHIHSGLQTINLFSIL